MRKVTCAFLLGCALLPLRTAVSRANHLDAIRSQYPYGLLGNDYGVLTEEDLAINTCGVNVTPFSKEANMAYSYWQCFPLKDVNAQCDSQGYDPMTKKELAHFGIDALRKDGLQSYTARDAMEIQLCRKWIESWRRKTKDENYVCLSGPYGGFSGIRKGKMETDWVFDKFKTLKGCVSFFAGECSLKGRSKKDCLFPLSKR